MALPLKTKFVKILQILVTFSVVIMQMEEVSSAELKSILDGGRPIKENEFPWTLGLINHSTGKLMCGGSILSEVHLITSGRCVHEWFNGTTRTVEPTSIKVIAGDNSLMEEEDSQQVFDVLEIHVHPDFVYDENYEPLSPNKQKQSSNEELRGFKNDLAILIVSRPFNFTDAVKPIKILDEKLDYGETLTIASWGITDKRQNTIPTGKILKKVEIEYSEAAKSSAKFGLYSKSENGDVIEFNSGIGTNKGLMGRCIGDPGGPVLCETTKGSEDYFLCGVVSFGIWCDRYYPSGQFVGIQGHIGWINSIIGSYLWAYMTIAGVVTGLTAMAIAGVVFRKRRNAYKC